MKNNNWHHAAYDKPQSGKRVLLRVEKNKNANNVQFVVGYHSGYEYCHNDEAATRHGGIITHFDRVTHWIELSK